MRNLFKAAALLVALGATAGAANAQVDVDAYIKRDKFTDMRLSPTGEYLAAALPLEDRTVLVILRRADNSISAKFTPEQNAHVALKTLRDDTKTPSHGLDHVQALVEQARGTGLKTTLTIDGQRHDVSTAVDRAAYRIVQESLTNTARHAAATTASIRIAYRPDTLAIRVDDDGKAAPDNRGDPIQSSGAGEVLEAW